MPIRRYRPADRAGCADVCVRTAAAGGDARGRYRTDELVPDVFCLPYLELEPDCAFVVDSGDRVIGYLVATPDSRSFAARYRARWLPDFAAKYPLPSESPDAEIIDIGLHPERMLIAELDAYPAHLHIDLLPEAQGQGWGRKLIDTLRSTLAQRGVPGVHLSLDPANVGAGRFYRRVGFHELPSSTPTSPVLGIATTTDYLPPPGETPPRGTVPGGTVPSGPTGP